MKNRIVFFLMMLFCATTVVAQVRQLVPRSDSSTAMIRCGAVLEDVKASENFTRRYVFNGNEILKNMQYCVAEAGVSLVDTHHEYQVPPGTVARISWDGMRGVLEDCRNQFEFVVPIPPPMQPTPTRTVSPVPTVVCPTPPPLVDTTPTLTNPKCVKVEIEKVDKKGTIVKLTAVMDDGSYISGRWVTEDGHEIGTGNEFLVSYKRLDKLFGKKPGVHSVKFIARDGTITCVGEIKLERQKHGWIVWIPCANMFVGSRKSLAWKAPMCAGTIGLFFVGGGPVGFKIVPRGGTISPI